MRRTDAEAYNGEDITCAVRIAEFYVYFSVYTPEGFLYSGDNIIDEGADELKIVSDILSEVVGMYTLNKIIIERIGS